MSASELKPAYILSGDDRPKVETALERLRARFDPGAIERFVAGEDVGRLELRRGHVVTLDHRVTAPTGR